MKSSPKLLQRLVITCILSFVFYINYLTVTNSRNVLYMDDWATPGEIIYSYLEGEIVIKDFLIQHNESRLVLTKIFSVILVKMGIYSTLISVYLRIFLSFVTCFIIYLMCRYEIKKNILLYVSVNLAIVFIPTQAYNMLFGMTFIGFVIPIILLLSTFIMFSNKGNIFKITLLLILCLVSTFTYANGMIAWVLCNPLLFNLFGRSELKFNRIHCGIFTAFGIITILFYFRGYIHPSAHPEISVVFQNPVRFIRFFIILIWSPFSMAWNKHLLSSVVLSITLLYVIYHYRLFLFEIIKLRLKLSIFKYAMFLTLGYGIISSLAISLGRFGFGVEYALADQYPSVTMWIHIAVLGLIFSINHKQIVSLRNYALVFYISMFLISFEYGVSKIKNFGKKYEMSELTIFYSEIIPNNPFLSAVVPQPEIRVLPKIKTFKENNIINVSNSGKELLSLAYSGNIKGELHFDSDGQAISFKGCCFDTGNNSNLDHFVIFDKETSGGYKPLLAATFNVINSDIYKKYNINDNYIHVFDHAILSNHVFNEPILLCFDLKSSKYFKVKIQS